MISEAGLGALLPYRQGDPYAHLDAENIMGGAGKLGIAAHVAVQVEVVDPVEVLEKVLSHSVKRVLVEKSVVGDEADDAIAALQTVGGPAEELHVGVVQFALAAGLGVFGVGVVDAPIHNLVLSVLVVVVLAFLPDVVWRVADDHG